MLKTKFEKDPQFGVISDTVPAGMLVTIVDDGSIVFINRAFTEILGCGNASVLGRSWQRIFFDPVERENLLVKFVEEGVVRNHEIRLQTIDGSVVWVLASLAAIDGYDDDVLLTTFVDVTPLKMAEEEVRYLAQTDALTGLPNRRFILETLERVVARRHADRVAVLLVDLDNFKSVNDAHGHDAGDLVLKSVSDRLQQAVRANDTIGRIGGDEFVVLLAGVQEVEDADLVAERIVASLSEPIAIAGTTVTIGASIGIALSPDHHTDPEKLLKCADTAMYEVKRSGKSGFAVANTPSPDHCRHEPLDSTEFAAR